MEYEVAEFVGCCEAVPVDVLGTVRCEYDDGPWEPGGTECVYAGYVGVIEGDYGCDDALGLHGADEMADGAVAEIPVLAEELGSGRWLVRELGRKACSSGEAGEIDEG